jgi:hypothetical protein
MRILRPIAVFLIPVLFAFMLAVAFSLSSFLLVVFAFLGAIPLLVGSLVAVAVLATSFVAARKSETQRPHAWVLGVAALGLAFSVVAFVPMVWAAGALVRDARQPLRALLSARVIQRTRAAGRTGKTKIRLTGLEVLLSDGGSIEVDSDASNASVLFWDWSGIMSGGATVYAQDPQATELPSGIAGQFDFHHDSGHWWSATEEQ